jgi:hypothetical protein
MPSQPASKTASSSTLDALPVPASHELISCASSSVPETPDAVNTVTVPTVVLTDDSASNVSPEGTPLPGSHPAHTFHRTSSVQEGSRLQPIRSPRRYACPHPHFLHPSSLTIPVGDDQRQAYHPCTWAHRVPMLAVLQPVHSLVST